MIATISEPAHHDGDAAGQLLRAARGPCALRGGRRGRLAARSPSSRADRAAGAAAAPRPSTRSSRTPRPAPSPRAGRGDALRELRRRRPPPRALTAPRGSPLLLRARNRPRRAPTMRALGPTPTTSTPTTTTRCAARHGGSRPAFVVSQPRARPQRPDDGSARAPARAHHCRARSTRRPRATRRPTACSSSARRRARPRAAWVCARGRAAVRGRRRPRAWAPTRSSRSSSTRRTSSCSSATPTARARRRGRRRAAACAAIAARRSAARDGRRRRSAARARAPRVRDAVAAALASARPHAFVIGVVHHWLRSCSCRRRAPTAPPASAADAPPSGRRRSSSCSTRTTSPSSCTPARGRRDGAAALARGTRAPRAHARARAAAAGEPVTRARRGPRRLGAGRAGAGGGGRRASCTARGRPRRSRRSSRARSRRCGAYSTRSARCARRRSDDDAVWFGGRACRLVRARGGACERGDHAAWRGARRAALRRRSRRRAPRPTAARPGRRARDAAELRAPTDAERAAAAAAAPPTTPLPDELASPLVRRRSTAARTATRAARWACARSRRACAGAARCADGAWWRLKGCGDGDGPFSVRVNAESGGAGAWRGVRCSAFDHGARAPHVGRARRAPARVAACANEPAGLWRYAGRELAPFGDDGLRTARSRTRGGRRLGTHVLSELELLLPALVFEGRGGALAGRPTPRAADAARAAPGARPTASRSTRPAPRDGRRARSSSRPARTASRGPTRRARPRCSRARGLGALLRETAPAPPATPSAGGRARARAGGAALGARVSGGVLRLRGALDELRAVGRAHESVLGYLCERIGHESGALLRDARRARLVGHVPDACADGQWHCNAHTKNLVARAGRGRARARARVAAAGGGDARRRCSRTSTSTWPSPANASTSRPTRRRGGRRPTGCSARARRHSEVCRRRRVVGVPVALAELDARPPRCAARAPRRAPARAPYPSTTARAAASVPGGTAARETRTSGRATDCEA